MWGFVNEWAFEAARCQVFVAALMEFAVELVCRVALEWVAVTAMLRAAEDVWPTVSRLQDRRPGAISSAVQYFRFHYFFEHALLHSSRGLLRCSPP